MFGGNRIIDLYTFFKLHIPWVEPNEFFLTDGTKFKLKDGYHFEHFFAIDSAKLVCCMEVSRGFCYHRYDKIKHKVEKGPAIPPGLVSFRCDLDDELELPKKPCNRYGREYEIDLIESTRTHPWLWELLYFMDDSSHSSNSSVPGSNALFTRHIVKMTNNPIQLLLIIVQVHAYMYEVAYYRQHQCIEGSPAYIFFDIDVDKRELRLFERLPEKPASNVSHEGNPWAPYLSHHQSKEAVLTCAQFMVIIMNDLNPLLGRIDDFVSKGHYIVNLLGHMIISNPKQRFSMIQVRQELSVIQSSQPWIDTNYASEFYSIKKGLCIIINNYNFIDEKRKRKGSDSDVDALRNTFGTILGFRVETHKDFTADEIRQLVTDFPKKGYLQPNDCVVFCIMSHGSEGVVYGVDDEPVKIREELIYAINDKTCPQLKDKPKVWITNACQDIISTFSVNNCTNLVKALWSEWVKSDKQTAPSLWLSSTMPGYSSARFPDAPFPGSPYIQALCKNLDSVTLGSPIKDIVEAHFKATEELMKTINQTPYKVEFGLIKKIGFLPMPNQLENVPRHVTSRTSGAVIVDYVDPAVPAPSN